MNEVEDLEATVLEHRRRKDKRPWQLLFPSSSSSSSPSTPAPVRQPLRQRRLANSPPHPLSPEHHMTLGNQLQIRDNVVDRVLGINFEVSAGTSDLVRRVAKDMEEQEEESVFRIQRTRSGYHQYHHHYHHYDRDFHHYTSKSPVRVSESETPQHGRILDLQQSRMTSVVSRGWRGEGRHP